MRDSIRRLRSQLVSVLRDTAVPTPHRAAAYQRRQAYRHHPGESGVEPTRFGDWEYNGRCTDFS